MELKQGVLTYYGSCQINPGPKAKLMNGYRATGLRFRLLHIWRVWIQLPEPEPKDWLGMWPVGKSNG
jgi:hypothetical protein